MYFGNWPKPGSRIERHRFFAWPNDQELKSATPRHSNQEIEKLPPKA
jgi:hypothetical protein